jgi:hypothetical protein
VWSRVADGLTQRKGIPGEAAKCPKSQ